MNSITGYLIGGDVVTDHARLQEINNPATGQVRSRWPTAGVREGVIYQCRQ